VQEVPLSGLYFYGQQPAEAVESKPEKPLSACPKCGMPLPCGIESFDVVDALRCPNCDALFERDNSFATAQNRRRSKIRAKASLIFLNAEPGTRDHG